MSEERASVWSIIRGRKKDKNNNNNNNSANNNGITNTPVTLLSPNFPTSSALPIPLSSSMNNNLSTGGVSEAKKRESVKVVVKYFEQEEELGKVVWKRIKKQSTDSNSISGSLGSNNGSYKDTASNSNNNNNNLLYISGYDLVDMVKKDDPWLQRHNPILNVFLYNENVDMETVTFAESAPSSNPDLNHAYTKRLGRRFAISRDNDENEDEDDDNVNNNSGAAGNTNDASINPSDDADAGISEILVPKELLRLKKSHHFKPIIFDQMYPLNSPITEFTLYVHRNVPVHRYIIHSTITFSLRNSANDFLQGTSDLRVEGSNSGLVVRIFNKKYHGYAKLRSGDRIPPGKGLITMLMERRLPAPLPMDYPTPSDDKSFFDDYEAGESNTYNFDDDQDEFEDTEEPSESTNNDAESLSIVSKEEVPKMDLPTVVKSQGFSAFADIERIPWNESYSKLEEVRQKLWSTVSIPTKREDVNYNTKQLLRKGVPNSLRGKVWMGIVNGYNKKKTLYHDTLCEVFAIPTDDFVLPSPPSAVTTREKAHNTKSSPPISTTTNNNNNTNGKDQGTPPPSPLLLTAPNPDSNQEHLDVEIEKINPSIVPDFGLGQIRYEQHPLTQEGRSAVKRILCVLAEQNPDVEFCPSLPDMVCLFMLFLNESESYICASSMLDVSRSHKWYFRINKMQHSLLLETFKDIITKKLPSIMNHFNKVGFDLETIATLWFDRLFVSFLPFQLNLRVIDMFVNEGIKVLYRVGYAMIKMFEKDILQIKDAGAIAAFFHEKPVQLDMNRYDELVKIAYKISVTRQDIEILDEKNRYNIPVSKLTSRSNMYYRPKIRGKSAIISRIQQWEILWSWIPPKHLIRDLQLLFTTKRDGYNLNTLYSKCKNCGPNILLIEAVPASPKTGKNSNKGGNSNNDGNVLTNTINIEDHPLELDPLALDVMERAAKKKKQKQLSMFENGRAIFGVFSPDSYTPTNQYYGSSDTFLFSLTPYEARYRKTGRNTWYILGKPESLSIGGGGDGPGLQIDGELLNGISKMSDTFLNDPLCTENFQIVTLEVYQFGEASKE